MEVPPYLIPIVLGVTGIGGGLWTAVNWRRDDTGKVVAQTQEVVTMLRALISELDKALERSERYGAGRDAELVIERAEVIRLRAELRLRTDELDVAEQRLVALRRKCGGKPGA